MKRNSNRAAVNRLYCFQSLSVAHLGGVLRDRLRDVHHVTDDVRRAGIDQESRCDCGILGGGDAVDQLRDCHLLSARLQESESGDAVWSLAAGESLGVRSDSDFYRKTQCLTGGLVIEWNRRPQSYSEWRDRLSDTYVDIGISCHASMDANERFRLKRLYYLARRCQRIELRLEVESAVMRQKAENDE